MIVWTIGKPDPRKTAPPDTTSDTGYATSTVNSRRRGEAIWTTF